MSSEYLKLFEFAQFKWLCDPYSLEIRYISREDELLACIAHFWPLGSDSGHNFHIHTSQILAGRIFLQDCSADKLNTYLEELKQGKLFVNDKTFELKANNGLSYYSEMISKERWFCDAHLRVSGGTITPFSATDITKINDELRLLALPFDGLPDLLNYLKIADPISGQSQSAI